MLIYINQDSSYTHTKRVDEQATIWKLSTLWSSSDNSQLHSSYLISQQLHLLGVLACISLADIIYPSLLEAGCGGATPGGRSSSPSVSALIWRAWNRRKISENKTRVSSFYLPNLVTMNLVVSKFISDRLVSVVFNVGAAYPYTIPIAYHTP